MPGEHTYLLIRAGTGDTAIAVTDEVGLIWILIAAPAMVSTHGAADEPAVVATHLLSARSPGAPLQRAVSFHTAGRVVASVYRHHADGGLL